MLKQITLYDHVYGLLDRKSGDKSRTWYFCGHAVREYFDLPKNCGRVTFTAYKRAGVNRVKFELIMARTEWGQNRTRVYIDGQRRYDFQFSTRDKIVKLLQKHGTFYVGCEYE